MRALAERIGLYRVAALVVGCALVLEVLRTQVVRPGSSGEAACTLGEVVFLVLAAGVFVVARRGR